MKSTINTKTSIFLIFLFLFQISFGQQTEKEDHSLNFATFNHRAEIDQGDWFATIDENSICLQLMDAKNRSKPSFIISLCIPEKEFTLNSGGGFELNRPAGTIMFQGDYPDDKGTGNFTYIRNSDFETFLNQEGISATDDDSSSFFKLFLGNISKEYVLEVKKHGYEPNIRQLGKLGIHHIDLDYINSIASTNYKGLELDMLIKFAIHDISIEYLQNLAKAGYGTIDANMVKKFAIHNVSVDFINGLSEAGYSDLDPNMVKNFAVHDITIDYIKGLSAVGFANLAPSMLKNFAVHDISPKYIKSIRDTGMNNPDASAFKKAKIHGLTASYIKRAQAKGHNSNELSDYIKLKIHGK